ncbi:hypothetical protein JXA40_00925 [bacterium]|nr:hypothetical protein [candidate division CSSED10-310 bacterium]
MTRQCLYCEKELPKNTASNFCSKECWNEYKKLKAMNIDVDKQATVLLKKSEIPIFSDNKQEPDEPDPIGDLTGRIDALERSLNDRLIELNDLLNTRIHSEQKIQPRDGVFEAGGDLRKRLEKMEENLTEFDQTVQSVLKMEERLAAVEKKIRQIQNPEPNKRRGFFARLFS